MGPDTTPMTPHALTFPYPCGDDGSAGPRASSRMGPFRTPRAPGTRQGTSRAGDARRVHEFTSHRIRLGEVVALRDMPALFEEVRRAAAIGARMVELDATHLVRLTDGARCMIEAAQRRWADYQVEVRFTAPLARTG
jgi:hypothetical protein